MKKFIAFHGNGNSGIQTKEKAVAWATDLLSKSSNAAYVNVAEVIEVVERTQPATHVKPFLVSAEVTEEQKTA